MPYKTVIDSKRVFNSSYLDKISMQGLFLKSKIPSYQKSIAGNYVTIKKIFSCTLSCPKITNFELKTLLNAGMIPLEETDDVKMVNELSKILDISSSNDKNAIILAENIFKIRVKELKFILSNVPVTKRYELKNGFIVFEKYLEFAAE